MVINKSRVVHLQRYINSSGVELPPDWDDFTEDAIFGRECVFCQHPHTLSPVFKYEPITQTREATGLHSCDACSGLIQGMIRERYPEQYREDVETGRELDFDEKDYGNRQYKLNLYNVNEQFDDTVESYIIHKNSTLKCYFCGEIAEIEDPEIHVPVSRSHQIDGGRVKVCRKKCYNDIWKSGQPESIHRSSKCSYCGGGYIITEDEQQTRLSTGTLGKHMCPECTFAGIEEEQAKNTVLADIVNTAEPFTRIIFKYCTICDEGFGIDLTLLHSRLKKIHTSNKGAPRCLECYVFGIEDTTRQRVYQLDENLYALIFYLDTSDKNWSYRISKIVNGEEKVLLRPDNTYRKSKLLDCIADAIDAVENIAKQTELDFN